MQVCDVHIHTYAGVRCTRTHLKIATTAAIVSSVVERDNSLITVKLLCNGMARALCHFMLLVQGSKLPNNNTC